jgi:phospholipase C
MSADLVLQAWDNLIKTLKAFDQAKLSYGDVKSALQDYINALAMNHMSTTHYVVIMLQDRSYAIRLCDLPKAIDENPEIAIILKKVWAGV